MPDIPVWPECDIRCVFCSNPLKGFRGTQRYYTLEKFKEKWEGYKAGRKTYFKFDAGRDFCSLTGGEPTLHPHFLRILRLLRKDSPRKRIRLLTNARRFARSEFASVCMRVGAAPFEIAVPVFGYDAKSHESVSRARGSFAETIRGLENIFRFRRRGQRVEVRIILHRAQLKHLDGLLDFLSCRFPKLDGLELLFVEIEGNAEKHWKALKLSMTECARELELRLPKLERFKGFKLLHFPLCVVPRRLWPMVWNTLDPKKVSFPAPCRKCRVRPHCVGVHNSYLKHVGPAEFKPIKSLKGRRPTDNWYNPFG